MKYIKEIELMYSPREEIAGYVSPVENEPEMTEDESAFLCGLIRKHKPSKILELGVAAGGSTAIILECLDELNLNETTMFYSVDLNEDFYRKDGRETGFMAREYKANKKSSFKHEFILGKYLPEIIDDIGGDIDFLIIDTVHSLPGELLDYLAVCSYLTTDAIVVLHDISYHLYPVRQGRGLSNTVLFNTVCSEEKFFPVDISEKNSGGFFPNIGAWRNDANARENVLSVLHALSIPWEYMPGQREIELYASFYLKKYGEDFTDRFLKTVKAQKEVKSNLEVRGIKSRVHRSLRMLLKGY